MNKEKSNNQQLRKSTTIFFLSLALMSCAGVTIQNENSVSSDDKGIRYYTQAPFILVHSDSKGGLTSKLIWLPDTTRVKTLRPYAIAAKNNSMFKFSDGVLTQAKTEIDTTSLPTALVTALKTSAVSSATASLNTFNNTSSGKVPAPILYKISNASGAWTLIESTVSPSEVNVTLTQQPKAK